MGTSFPEKHWYRLSPLSVALWPLSLVFRLVVAMRRLLYRLRVLPGTKLPVPVIVVGNITAGGTGKTPLVLWLATMLRRHGRTPGILSRGYGGSASVPMEVSSDSAAGLVGDEPLLLAQRSGSPVWVGRDRVMAASKLLRAHPECDLLILDDGLQHYAIGRDIEIALEDERGAGNGLMIPAGPLREPRSRRVDARVCNVEAGPAEAESAGTSANRFRMRLRGEIFRQIAAPHAAVPAASLAGRKLHAVAGIGNPQRFFDHLARLGLATVNHAFPDHHAYAPAELDFRDCEALLMTEKDAVKCSAFARAHWYALRVEAELDAAFTEFILARLNGSKTA